VPAQVPHSSVEVFAAGEYAGGLRRVVLAYKERGRRDLAPLLARSLAEAGWRRPEARLRLVGEPAAVLVPVPSRRAAARERGGDHVWRLVRALAAETGQPAARVLRLGSRVRDSVGLNALERARNLAGQMAARPPGVPGRRALLVDDVLTSGATLSESARALRAAGWDVSQAAVIAHTASRDGPGSRRPSAS
jgi:predicted amidophosphoribosyltransferase